MNKVERYKYLRVVLNEYRKYDTAATILSESAGRTLSAVIARTKHLTDFGFKTIEKLFCSRFVPKRIPGNSRSIGLKVTTKGTIR